MVVVGLERLRVIKSYITLDIYEFSSRFFFVISFLNSGGLILGNSRTGAIAGGVAAGAALLFAAPAIALAWWRRRKPQDHFFDVPG